MFYRVGKFKHESGKTDEIMDFFKSNEDTFKASEGLKGVFYFKASEEEVVGVAMWESKEHFEQSADRIQSVLSGLAELISGPPEVYEGNSGYIFDRG